MNDGHNQPATKEDVAAVQSDVTAVKEDLVAVKDDVTAVKADVAAVAHDLDELARATKAGFDRIEQQSATKEDLKRFATKDDLKRFATKDDLAQLKTEIVNEFKVVAENIHQDVAAANQDEISLLKDQQVPQLERRVTKIEQHVGIAKGS